MIIFVFQYLSIQYIKKFYLTNKINSKDQVVIFCQIPFCQMPFCLILFSFSNQYIHFYLILDSNAFYKIKQPFRFVMDENGICLINLGLVCKQEVLKICKDYNRNLCNQNIHGCDHDGQVFRYFHREWLILENII